MITPLADELVLALAQSDRHAVTEHCTSLIREGLELRALVDEGLAPAMREVGSLWEGGVWSVLDEHLATAVVEAGLSAASAEADQAGSQLGDIVVGCVEGDWHSLPVRMVAEVLANEGWAVRFLGASQPTHSLVTYVQRHRPNAVLLSCAIPMALPALAAAVQDLHEVGVPVYVGGRAVASAERAQRLGADGWAANAAAAVQLLHDSPRSSGHDMTEALAHWQARAVGSEQWLDAAMIQLGLLMPTMATYPAAILGRTRADLQHLVETASTCLLLEESALLLEQCTWLARVLSARGVPEEALGWGLQALQATQPASRDTHQFDALLRAAQQTVAA